ncbi:MAG: hypothetical protein EU539_10385 [Promethearchaeota archaeon]|nr:MAG: hypothetical protein EU539_10385 [Candidatus Lokiarchaeota archaeon]
MKQIKSFAMKEKNKAILFLIFFAPFVGEGLSMSTPAIAWLDPLVIILLVFLYGFGALIMREFLIKWEKGSEGYVSLLFLGAAYGIIEEGLFLMSFFNPLWEDVGILGIYGRYFGVNWIWVVELMIFHMIYSITIPIVLTHIAFPQVKEESWLDKKSFLLILVIFISCAPIWMTFVISTYNYIPGMVEYVGFLILTGVLILIAKKAPSNILKKKEVEAPGFKLYFFLGLIWAVGFFAIAWFPPILQINPIIPLFLMPAFSLFIIWVILNTSGNGYALNEENTLALIIGAISFLLFLLLVVDILSFMIFGTSCVLIFALIIIKVKKGGENLKREL